MKFVYEYRTADNVPHCGTVEASTRDGAYAALKLRGIRPSRVAEADGFFNKLLGKGKRWMVIALLGALCLALGAVIVRLTGETNRAVDIFGDTTRHQLIGDAGVIEKGIATGWSDVFDQPGDRYFASYAIPGVPAVVSRVTESEMKAALAEPPRLPDSSASLETRQIVALVEGMKRECRDYIADGTKLSAYHRALVQRQEQEVGYYQRAKAELERAWGKIPHGEFMSLWERRNSQLRKIGVKLVPWPED